MALEMLHMLNVLVPEMLEMLDALMFKMLDVLRVPEVLKVPGMRRVLRCPGTLGQVNLLHGLALDGGRRAGRPQSSQQQRRLAQVRAAPILPVPAVGGRGGRAQL